MGGTGWSRGIGFIGSVDAVWDGQSVIHVCGLLESMRCIKQNWKPPPRMCA